MSSLIARLLRTAQEDHPAEVKVPLDAGARPPSIMPEVGSAGWGQLAEGEQVMVCFSCGRPGHGVSRCSRVDTSFPFLPQGWSVEVRDGQYRAVWLGGARVWSLPGNKGWSGWEGQPPGPSVIRERLTPAEDSVVLEEIGRREKCAFDLVMTTTIHVPGLMLTRVIDTCLAARLRQFR